MNINIVHYLRSRTNVAHKYKCTFVMRMLHIWTYTNLCSVLAVCQCAADRKIQADMNKTGIGDLDRKVYADRNIQPQTKNS
jgi:hypothetical protein